MIFPMNTSFPVWIFNSLLKVIPGDLCNWEITTLSAPFIINVALSVISGISPKWTNVSWISPVLLLVNFSLTFNWPEYVLPLFLHSNSSFKGSSLSWISYHKYSNFNNPLLDSIGKISLKIASKPLFSRFWGGTFVCKKSS